MDRIVSQLWMTVLVAVFLCSSGCQSPYRADQGALVGGWGGAGVGALVGHAVGNTGAGAAIGAGVGALSGALVGQNLDDIEANNRALIEAKLQRPIGKNAVTIDDVIAMSKAGVADEVIANHVRIHGVVRQLQASDIIMLQQQGVSAPVIRAMQEPPISQRETVVVDRTAPPPRVIVEEHYYRDPWYHPYRYPYGGYYYRPAPPPRARVGVGFTF